jgi:hypothetical protein
VNGRPPPRCTACGAKLQTFVVPHGSRYAGDSFWLCPNAGPRHRYPAGKEPRCLIHGTRLRIKHGLKGRMQGWPFLYCDRCREGAPGPQPKAPPLCSSPIGSPTARVRERHWTEDPVWESGSGRSTGSLAWTQFPVRAPIAEESTKARPAVLWETRSDRYIALPLYTATRKYERSLEVRRFKDPSSLWVPRNPGGGPPDRDCIVRFDLARKKRKTDLRDARVRLTPSALEVLQIWFHHYLAPGQQSQSLQHLKDTFRLPAER